MAKRSRKKSKNPQAIWWICFILYIILMIWLLFCRTRVWTDGLSYQQMLQENINLKPLYTIKNYINVILHYPNSAYYDHCIINLIGNVIMFIPAGLFFPRLFLFLRNFIFFVLTSLACIIFIETLQLFVLVGSFDVDDIILNISGFLIGYMIFKITAKNRNL